VSGIPSPPAEFDGQLGEFFDRWAQRVLLPTDAVEEFHDGLREYLASRDPIYLVRSVAGLTRAQTIRTANGSWIRATDNAPAWWIHRELFLGGARRTMPFDAFIAAVPCHMFHLGTADHVSTAGWHVAHIFNAKNRDTDFQRWTREELARRLVRNIHPCNYFYVPKTDWSRTGGDPAVIAYFADQFAARYTAVWSEFLALAGATQPALVSAARVVRFTYPVQSTSGVRTPQQTVAGSRSGAPPDSMACVVRYEYSRLCFKADLIEPLGPDDRFCVSTPDGDFVFSRREFEAEFPNVVQSMSYRVRRIYHFPRVPARALAFRVSPER
jgi:hypothetical protein